MKKLALATAAILAVLSVAGCAQVGKGKAPPPPVVTKG
jgi:predicted small lipoprotein YifL